MKRILIFVTVVFIFEAEAKNNKSPYLAVGQGIAVPAYTSPINFSHGYTYTNAAVAAHYEGVQLTLEHTTPEEDSNADSSTGAEFAIGTGNVGLGIGHIKRDCDDDCKGASGAIAGFSASSFSFGLGYHEEDNYSLGLIIGHTGTHRLGMTADLFKGPNEDDDIRSYGLGYGYVSNSVIFTLDASKKENEVKVDSDKIIMLTPGLEVQAQSVALSVSHDMYLNDEEEVNEETTWFGAGFQFSAGSFNVYHDYVNEWAFVLALNF